MLTSFSTSSLGLLAVARAVAARTRVRAVAVPANAATDRPSRRGGRGPVHAGVRAMRLPVSRSERQPAFAGGVGQRLDAAMEQVAAAVEDDLGLTPAAATARAAISLPDLDAPRPCRRRS